MLIKSLWSDPSAWVLGRPPKTGEDVSDHQRNSILVCVDASNVQAIINGTRWIVMDIVPPTLGCLKVYGKLTLSPGLNVTISVACVEVYGVLDISDGLGGAYDGNVNLQLYGTKQNSVPIIVGESCLHARQVRKNQLSN